MAETKQIKGCCPLDCQDTCSWIAHVEDDCVVRVEGTRDHPFTRGVPCAKVGDYQTRTCAKDRLLHPLHRTGEKGSGSFERIAWDEVLDTIAERWKTIIREDGAEALIPLFYLGSMGVVQHHALMRLPRSGRIAPAWRGMRCLHERAVGGRPSRRGRPRTDGGFQAHRPLRHQTCSRPAITIGGSCLGRRSALASPGPK